jgi:hypothetical protein
MGFAAILNEVFCQDQARLGWVSLLLPTHAPQLKVSFEHATISAMEPMLRYIV